MNNGKIHALFEVKFKKDEKKLKLNLSKIFFFNNYNFK
jgi:hypothetical protein